MVRQRGRRDHDRTVASAGWWRPGIDCLPEVHDVALAKSKRGVPFVGGEEAAKVRADGKRRALDLDRDRGRGIEVRVIVACEAEDIEAVGIALLGKPCDLRGELNVALLH